MTQKMNKPELSQKQQEEIDELALERVRAMNSDEYLCQRIDQKVHLMEDHLKEFFYRQVSAYSHKESN